MDSGMGLVLPSLDWSVMREKSIPRYVRKLGFGEVICIPFISFSLFLRCWSLKSLECSIHNNNGI